MTFLCTLHQVEYGSEPQPECKEADLKFAKLPRCPVCVWNEFHQLRDELGRVAAQRDALVRAIELKQEHLTLKRT